MINADVIMYGGVALIAALLLIFEVRDFKRKASNTGYEFYTVNGKRVRIRQNIRCCYKVYVFSEAPVSTKRDRFGKYFMVKARSTAEAEAVIDNIYDSYKEENN